jgi:hypothetical protein
MTDYKKELKGAIKGCSRMSRRFKEQRERCARLTFHISLLIDLADSSGLGNDYRVRNAAASLGWYRKKK